MENEFEVVQTVRNAVARQLRWLQNDGDQAVEHGLRRLSEYKDAQLAWLKLAQKQPLNPSEGFTSAVFEIVNQATYQELHPSWRKSAKEIRLACETAAQLATRLVELIQDNGVLRMHGYEVVPKHEAAATSRITRALSHMEKREFGTGRWFSEAIERELDELQARDYPEHADMTTLDAYRILRSTELHDDAFIARLERFAELARKRASIPPVLSKPNAESADQHQLANEICYILNRHYGGPCIEIATSFLSAIYDEQIDSETVKKWWARNGDK